MRLADEPNGRGPRPVDLALPHSWRVLLDAIPAGVVVVGAGGLIVFANVEVEAITGYPPAGLSGRPVETLVPEGRRVFHAGARAEYEELPVRRPMGTNLDISCRRADGSVFPADISLSPLDLDGELFVIATISDETERRRSAEELFHRAVHDPLTGLANRVLLVDRLTQALARADRQARRLAVLYVDLDGFKAVNDTWRHTVGDEVLQAVATRLAAVVRPEDTVARFGGDEFVVLCEELSGPAGAVRVAHRMLEEVARPIPHRSGSCRLGASIGVVLADGHTTAAELIEAADRAMYRVKRRGGRNVEIVVEETELAGGTFAAAVGTIAPDGAVARDGIVEAGIRS